ncbi:MAG: fasciclin domain-containing protein [Deinococcota bacterium]
MKSVTYTLIATVLLLWGTALAQDGTTSVVEIVSSDAQLSTLTSVVVATGLVEVLEQRGSYTIFAPTNDAFAAVPESVLQALLADPAALLGVLEYHIVPGALVAANVVQGSAATTLFGEDVTFDGATISGANIIATDLMATNGVVHLIDSVILPGSLGLGEPEELDDLVELVTSEPQFSTLATALEAADLLDVLRSGTFTVFAPTNDAFAKVPREDLNALLADVDALRDVLTYHVLVGDAIQKDLINFEDGSAGTVQGDDVMIGVMDGMVMVNDASIVSENIIASNGVIQVIDTVLIPGM